MALSLIQSGAFSVQPDKMKVNGGTIRKTTAIREITGAGDALAAAFAYGRATWLLNLHGVYATSAGGSTTPMPVIGSAITGSPLFRLSRAVVVMQQRVKNTSGAETAFPYTEFTPGTQTFAVSLAGWSANPDTPLTDVTSDYPEITTLTLPIYSTGPVHVTGAARVTSYNVGEPFEEGGPIPITVGAVYTGAVTDTNCPTDVSTYSNLAFDLDGGEAWTNVDVVPNSVRMVIDYENALPTTVNVSGAVTGEFTIT